MQLTQSQTKDNGLDKVKVFKTAMRIIIEDESCDIIENASLLLERIKQVYAADYRKQRYAISSHAKDSSPSTINRQADSSPNKLEQRQQQQQQKPRQPRHKLSLVTKVSPEASSTSLRRSQTSDRPLSTGATRGNDDGGTDALVMGTSNTIAQAKFERELAEGARAICDEVIRDSIGSCSEPDYKMELAKLLSGEAKIELYIEHGKLSNAQRLACSMNRPDYVSRIIKEAAKLNQNHVKTVCQLWLAKHETRNSIR